jgi:hypothetical protein
MRSFDDSQGNRWEAALLGASYGNILLVFSPPEGHGIRQQLLPAENQEEADAYLAALSDDQLRTLLAEAEPWDSGH